MDNCISFYMQTKSCKGSVVSHGQMADFYKALSLMLQVITPCKKLVVWLHETKGIIPTSTLIYQLYHFMDSNQSTSLTSQSIGLAVQISHDLYQLVSACVTILNL